MRELTIDTFLRRLASREPAPGGGATAGLHAAQAAALLAMVARFSSPATSEVVDQILTEAQTLLDRAVHTAGEDMAAFEAVIAAYRLPAEDPAARTAAIAEALAGAAQPPLDVIAVADRLVGLTEALLPVGNRTVITDVAAAAEAARAAATTSRVNVEINLRGVTDPAVRARCQAALETIDPLVRRAELVTAAVRREIAA